MSEGDFRAAIGIIGVALLLVLPSRAQNISNSTINFASIAVNYYDKGGNLIGTASGVKQNLSSGEVWDFNIKLAGPDAWKSVDYDIAASASE